jgi:hypothetical protein
MCCLWKASSSTTSSDLGAGSAWIAVVVFHFDSGLSFESLSRPFPPLDEPVAGLRRGWTGTDVGR